MVTLWGNYEGISQCFSAVEEIEAKLPKVQKISHRYIERGSHIPEIEKTKKL